MTAPAAPVNRIREYRTGRGWTLAQLARKVGLTPQRIGYIELRTAWPRQQTREKIAAIFGVPATVAFPNWDKPDMMPKRRAGGRCSGPACPDKVPCSWCGAMVCPHLAIEITDEKGTKVYCRAKCVEEDMATREPKP